MGGIGWAQASADGASPGSKPRVLLIDDDPDFVELYRIVLSRDFEFAAARDGEEGIREIGEFRPEAVLLDLRMPRASGFEVLEHMQARPALRSIPVIVMTARRIDPGLLRLLTSNSNVCAAWEKTVTPGRVRLETGREILLSRLFAATPPLLAAAEAVEANRRG